tara:strand:+ start:1663 stop:2502 length:840 start_codon:yes stop_codon:yes gene_type:complete
VLNIKNDIMKIIIFTYDRFETITTSKYFKNVEHTILCHDNDSKNKFIDAGNIYGNIIATKQPKGLSNNRNFALDMLKDDEWALFFVDDLKDVTMLGSYFEQKTDRLDICYENQKIYNNDFNTECNVDTFIKICKETILHADKKGYALCGFSLTGNVPWRDKKYGYWSLVDGRCWLVKKTKLRQDKNVNCIEDYHFTALNLKTFGGVVVNNWVLTDCVRYGAGSYGSLKKRMPQKIKESKYLINKFPEFLMYADKANMPKYSHIRIRPKRKYNPKQINLF